MPSAWTLGLPGALPPGPLGVTSQQPTYCLSQSVAHCTSHNQITQSQKITSQKKFNKYQFYKSNPVSISLYTTFTVCPLSVIFNNTFSLFPDVHRESPTYNCPCEKTGDLKSNPTCANDCP